MNTLFSRGKRNIVESQSLCVAKKARHEFHCITNIKICNYRHNDTCLVLKQTEFSFLQSLELSCASETTDERRFQWNLLMIKKAKKWGKRKKINDSHRNDPTIIYVLTTFQ